MATIDLGKIKQVWRGTYNNSTAYTVDDLVAYTDTVSGNPKLSSYICVTNSTGNAPASGGTVHSSWNLVADGAIDPIPSQSGEGGKFLKTNGTNLLFESTFVSGMILLWSGATNAIPTGWVICDGQNNTPDLRDRFVIGAGSTYAVDATGGSTTTTVSGSTNALQGENSNITGRSAGGNMYGASTGHAHGVNISGVSIIPPYYALAYIMKT